MMARTWPTITDLQNMLFGAGVLSAVPPTGAQSATYLDYQGALDAAREDFERDVRIRPFLADGSEAQRQYLQFSGSPGGGTVKLSYAGIVMAGTFAYNGSAASLQAALEGLSSIGSGKVAVTGDAGGPYTAVLDSSLAPYSWILLNTNSLTGGTSPSLTVDEPPEFENGNRGYLQPLTDTWFSIRSVSTDRFNGGDGISRTLHTDYEFEYRQGWKGIEALRFNQFLGGGGPSVSYIAPAWMQVVGRRGLTDDLPANVFKATLACAANKPDMMPLFAAKKSGGAVEWKEGDVSEKVSSVSATGVGGSYASQMTAWDKLYQEEVGRYFRMRGAGG